ncbi:MAG: hypothetical protein WKF82_01040 [Nocardioidaceae bacterium]
MSTRLTSTAVRVSTSTSSVRHLRATARLDVDVLCMGAERPDAHRLRRARPTAFATRTPRCTSCRPIVAMAAALRRRVTCCTPTPGTPTWPAISAALLYDVPHVVSRALAGAAAAVEGRAARRRLPDRRRGPNAPPTSALTR